MADEALDLAELFHCDRFVGMFPTGMPYRACLRRQAERKRLVGPNGKPAEWADVHPYCAAECPLGRENAARFPGVARSCPSCGAARLGGAACTSCSAAAAGDQVPVGVLPRPSLPPWRPDLPDTPFVPPKASPRAAPLLPRQHRPTTTAPSADTQEPTMPKPSPSPERRTCAAPGCSKPLRSDNRSGACTACSKARKVPRAAKAGPREAPAAPRTRAAAGEPMSERVRRSGHALADLVAEKNRAYGSSFEKTGAFLRLLYPEGIQPEQYDDLGLIFRVFDKQMRIATRKTAFGESPWSDVAGYGLLGAAKDEKPTGQA